MGGFDGIAALAFLRVMGIIIGLLGFGFVIGVVSCMLYFNIKWGVPVWEMILS